MVLSQNNIETNFNYYGQRMKSNKTGDQCKMMVII